MEMDKEKRETVGYYYLCVYLIIKEQSEADHFYNLPILNCICFIGLAKYEENGDGKIIRVELRKLHAVNQENGEQKEKKEK